MSNQADTKDSPSFEVKFKRMRENDLRNLLEAEEGYEKPKVGELWRARFEEQVAMTFWADKVDEIQTGRLQALTVKGRSVVLLWDVIYDDSQWARGIEQRWKFRVVVDGKVCFRLYTSLMGWYRDFEKVS